MPLELPSPWNWLVTVGIALVLGSAIFWLSLHHYHRRYFFDKALQLAFLRTVGWLLMYGGSAALLYWLSALVTPVGWLRYLVMGCAWWLLSETVLAFAWQGFDRLLEVL